jgi:hypothetical protein
LGSETKSKPVFADAHQALAALAMDKLGTVYYKANEVFVATSHGTGTFTLKDWTEAKGHKNSMVKE